MFVQNTQSLLIFAPTKCATLGFTTKLYVISIINLQWNVFLDI